jgi:sulfite reductase alpha subunit-like flavoprotein
MFLAAIFVVLLSILYLLYNLQEDAPVNNPNCLQDVAETTPSRRETTTEGASVRGAQRGALNIFFGSQTGKAEAFAKSLAQICRRRGFAPSVFDLQHFDEALLMLPTACTAPPAVFLLATYGEGEPTDNARRFCTWLKDHAKKSRHLAPLQGLRIAVFGLGDRRYEQFNPVALLVDKQLALLGAHRLLHVGLGDDAKDLTADFSRWTSAFWAAFDPSDSPCPTSHTPPHAKTHSTSSPAHSHTLRSASALADNNKLASDEEDVVFTIDSFASREEALAAMRDRGLNSSTSCMLDALPTCRGVVRRKLELHRGGPRSCLHLEVESAEDAWRSAAAAEEVEKEEEEEGGGEEEVKGATTARLAPSGRLGQLRWETGGVCVVCVYHVGVHAHNNSAFIEP